MPSRTPPVTTTYPGSGCGEAELVSTDAEDLVSELAPTKAAAGHLLMALASFGQLVSQALAEAAPDGEFVSNHSIQVMCHLELDGPTRPAELAALTGLSSGGISKLIDRLELAGLTTRHHHGIADNHRAVLISLTLDGKRTVHRFIGIFDNYLDDATEMIDRLTSTLNQRKGSSF